MMHENSHASTKQQDSRPPLSADEAEVVRAMEVGLFLEYVERNPGKGCLRRLPKFREDLAYDYEGIEESWTEFEVFEYPNNRWVISNTYRHVEIDWLSDQTEYQELSPPQAARTILTSKVELSLDDLIRLTELTAQEPTGQGQVHWNPDRGELTIDGQIARYIRNPKGAKNAVKVLAIFQEENWPERIDSPFSPDEAGKQKLRDTVSSLNDRSQGIRFSADGTGEGIRFHLTSDSPPPDQAKDDIPF